MTAECYESIEDLPLWNWNKVHEKSDYTYLRINRINGQVTKEEYLFLKNLWEKLFAEYIDTFRFSKEFLAIMEKKIQIAYYQKEFLLSGDLSLQTQINLMEMELEGMQPIEETKQSFWQSKATIERLLQFQIDAKKITVIEYYSHIENLKREKKLT